MAKSGLRWDVEEQAMGEGRRMPGEAHLLAFPTRRATTVERYWHRSPGVALNVACGQWEKMFANPMATAAAIDRIVHHSVILEFDLPSYRTDEAHSRHMKQESDRQK